MAAIPPDDGKTVSTSGIAALLGMSPATIRAWADTREDFPRPCMGLSKRTRRWDRATILAWRDELRAKIQGPAVSSEAQASTAPSSNE